MIKISLLNVRKKKSKTGENDDIWIIRKGYLFAALIFVGFFLQSILLNRCYTTSILVALHARNATRVMIVKKVLSLSPSARSTFSGRVNTLMSNDTCNIETVIIFAELRVLYTK